MTDTDLKAYECVIKHTKGERVYIMVAPTKRAAKHMALAEFDRSKRSEDVEILGVEVTNQKILLG